MTNLVEYAKLEAAVEVAADHYQTLYLSWLNNYTSTPKFAEENGLTLEEAHQSIKIGDKIHAQRTQGE